jgi:hypothetical protein
MAYKQMNKPGPYLSKGAELAHGLAGEKGERRGEPEAECWIIKV